MTGPAFNQNPQTGSTIMLLTKSKLMKRCPPVSRWLIDSDNSDDDTIDERDLVRFMNGFVDDESEFMKQCERAEIVRIANSKPLSD